MGFGETEKLAQGCLVRLWWRQDLNWWLPDSQRSLLISSHSSVLLFRELSSCRQEIPWQIHATVHEAPSLPNCRCEHHQRTLQVNNWAGWEGADLVWVLMELGKKEPTRSVEQGGLFWTAGKSTQPMIEGQRLRKGCRRVASHVYSQNQEVCVF